jgi:hypothetical protein
MIHLILRASPALSLSTTPTLFPASDSAGGCNRAPVGAADRPVGLYLVSSAKREVKRGFPWSNLYFIGIWGQSSNLEGFRPPAPVAASLPVQDADFRLPGTNGCLFGMHRWPVSYDLRKQSL